MAWTLRQQRALAIVPKISGSMSIMGSIFIITDILKSREKLGRTYSRILLVMSCYDFFTSVAQALSTWPIPEGTDDVQYAAGTTFTCTFQGFFTQLGVGAPMYNCALSFYYLIVIAFAFSETKVKRIEWFMHGIPLLLSFGTAIAGLPLTLYNSAGLWCWISSLPDTCGNTPEGDGECERGDNAWIYRWAIYYGPVWFCVLTITFNMVIVSYLVWAKERASQKFQFGQKSTLSCSVVSQGSTRNGMGESVNRYYGENNENKTSEAKANAGRIAKFFAKRQQKQQRKKKPGLASQVFWQAFYYVVGFYVTWICPTLLRLLQTIEKPVPFWVVMAMATLLPFQGFFNFMVYVRPRVVQYQHRHPEKGLLNAMSRAINRTITVLYTSDSRAFTETEVQDIEALDPCYALQIEKEEEKAERRRTSQEVITKSKLMTFKHHGDDISGHNIEKSPFHDSISEQLRLDEMKLLEEDDPSFYEGQSSRLWDDDESAHSIPDENGHNCTVSGQSDDDDVYIDDQKSEDGNKAAKQPLKARSDDGDVNSNNKNSEDGNKATQQPLSVQSDDCVYIGDNTLEDGDKVTTQPLAAAPKEGIKSGFEDTKQRDNTSASNYPYLEIIYPEFTAEPDFFFT